MSYEVFITWNIEDVLSLDDTLDEDQCIEVLNSAIDNHDANFGINWNSLQIEIDRIKD